MDVYQGEFVGPGHPAFPPGSPAAIGQSSGPVPIDAPDIEYSDKDDDAIDIYCRRVGKCIYIRGDVSDTHIFYQSKPRGTQYVCIALYHTIVI